METKLLTPHDEYIKMLIEIRKLWPTLAPGQRKHMKDMMGELQLFIETQRIVNEYIKEAKQYHKFGFEHPAAKELMQLNPSELYLALIAIQGLIVVLHDIEEQMQFASHRNT